MCFEFNILLAVFGHSNQNQTNNMFAIVLCVMNASQKAGEEEIFVEKVNKTTKRLPDFACRDDPEEDAMLHRILMEFLLYKNEEGQAVDVKFYDSAIPFKTDDTWSGKKTRVYVANHTMLDPKACDNETFVNEMDGRDCQLVCLSELAKNSRMHLHPKSKAYIEELAREHIPDVLGPTGLHKCKALQHLIGTVLLRDALK